MKDHPTFGKWFQRTFLRGWMISAFMIAGALIANATGHAALTQPMGIGFAVTLGATMTFLYWRLFNVDCPDCGSRAKTTNKKPEYVWVATCPRCGVTWNLGVGSDETN